MWSVNDLFEIAHKGIQNTTIGKQYTITNISMGSAVITEYGFIDDLHNFVYVAEYIFNACVVKPSQKPSRPWFYLGDWDLEKEFNSLKIKKDRCTCGSSSVGHPGHSHYCDLVTGKQSL